MRGRVLQLHAKPAVEGEHGLPKPAVGAAWLAAEGVEGDHNRHRSAKGRGDPTSAVLLLPAETLAQLRAEGWPVLPGHLGENLTTEGVPYATLGPGQRWVAGGATLEVTRVCDPCTNLYALPYVGPARGPAFLRTLVGRRGWYAAVVGPGLVRPGDPLRLEGKA